MESFEEYLFKLYEELKLLNEILSKRATTPSKVVWLHSSSDNIICKSKYGNKQEIKEYLGIPS